MHNGGGILGVSQTAFCDGARMPPGRKKSRGPV